MFSDRAFATCEEAGLQLDDRPEGLTLVGNGIELRPDFAPMLKRTRNGRLSRELLVRAARLKQVTEAPVVIDATAGLGEDSFLLAAAGYRVDLYENDPVIFALLQDALQRAAKDDRLRSIAAHMTAHEADSISALRNMTATPDVVYLDPMFPERKKSAAVKKKFQLLHHLERPCEDECELINAALAARPHKVVIKRPIKGPYLGEVKPAYSLSGKAVRYDVLLPAQMK